MCHLFAISSGPFYAFPCSIACIFAREEKNYTKTLHIAQELSVEQKLQLILIDGSGTHLSHLLERRRKKTAGPGNDAQRNLTNVTNLMDIMQCRQTARQVDVCKFTQCIALYGAERACLAAEYSGVNVISAQMRSHCTDAL